MTTALSSHRGGAELLSHLSTDEAITKHIESLAQALAQYNLFPDIEEFVDTLVLSVRLEKEMEKKPEPVKETPLDSLWLIPTFVEDTCMAHRKPSLLAFKKKVEGAFSMMGRPLPQEIETRTSAKLGMPSTVLYTGGYSAFSSSTVTDRATKLAEARKAMFEQKAGVAASAPAGITSFTPYESIMVHGMNFSSSEQQIQQQIQNQQMMLMLTTPSAMGSASFSSMDVPVASTTGGNERIVVPTGSSAHFQRYMEKKAARKSPKEVAAKELKKTHDSDDEDGSSDEEESRPKKKVPAMKFDAVGKTMKKISKCVAESDDDDDEPKKSAKKMPAKKSADDDDGGEDSDEPRKKRKVLAVKEMKKDVPTKKGAKKLPHMRDDEDGESIMDRLQRMAAGSSSASSSTTATKKPSPKSAPARKGGIDKGAVARQMVPQKAEPSAFDEPLPDPNSFYPTLIVKTLTGKTLTFANTLKPSSTVQEFKQQISAQIGVPPHAQRLIHLKKEIQDGKTLSDYRVNSSLNLFYLLLRLSGRSPPSSSPDTSSSNSSSSSSNIDAASSSSSGLFSGAVKGEPAANLSIGWSKMGSVYVRGLNYNLPGAAKVAAFDMDQTLIRVKSGAKFPKNEHDWEWLCADVVPKIEKLIASGFRIAILTNQNGIEKGLQRANDIMNKIDAIAKKLGETPDTPIFALVATGKDKYRKPSPMLWNMFIEVVNKDVIPGPDSFFVGDAAGRKKDHSCADRSFALNAGLRFVTEDVFFLDQPETPLAPIHEHEAVKALKAAAKEGRVEKYGIEPLNVPVEIVLMCGMPGSGKSTIYKSIFQPRGYEHVNLDTEHSASKCLSIASSFLSAHKSIVVDQTFPSKKSREPYLQLAKKFKVPVRIVVLKVPIPVAKHLNTIRNWLFDVPHVPDVGYHMFHKHFEEPTASEGFKEVTKLAFRLSVDDPKVLAAIQWVTD